MKEIYGIDMEANGQHSKLITDIPDVDIAISMGCNVGCPFIGRAFDDNWGLDDPTGKSDDDFKAVIQRIEENIMELIGICGTGNLDYMRRGESRMIDPISIIVTLSLVLYSLIGFHEP